MPDFIANDFCALPAIGLVAASSNGTPIALPTVNNTQGSKTQIVASTPDEANGFIVILGAITGGSSAAQILVNLYIGASGQEVPLVTGIQIAKSGSSIGAQRIVTVPLNIPAGSRISASMQADIFGNCPEVRCTIIPLGIGFAGAQPCDAFEAWGVNTATSMGTEATASATQYTKGAWVEMIAATGLDSQQIVVQLQRASLLYGRYRLDIGVGASGSEVVAVGDITFIVGNDGGTDASQYCSRDMTLHIPLTIPAGSRISMRIESNGASATARASILAFGN
jgi:hypothetical protein